MSTTRRICSTIVLLVSAGLMMGQECLPRRVFWSPDGQHALITAPEATYVCDAEGKLSAPLKATIKDAVWFKDNQRLLVVREESVSTWEEVKAAMPADRAEELIKLAGRLREEILLHKGKDDHWESPFLKEISQNEFFAVLTYVREHLKEGLPENPNKESEETPAVPIQVVQFYELSAGNLAAGQVLFRQVNEVRALRLPRHEKCLAYVSAGPGTKGWTLVVRELKEPSEARMPVRYVATLPDWSPDGRSLVYAKSQSDPNTTQPADDEYLPLGRICVQQVCELDGSLKVNLGIEETLASIAFAPDTRIRCLADGSVLLGARDESFPREPDNKSHNGLSLFVLNMHGSTRTLTRQMARTEGSRETQPVSAAVFDVCADGRRVAITAGQNVNEIFVYDLQDGRLQALNPKKRGDSDVACQAVWRSNDELCVAVPVTCDWGSDNRPEMVLWSARSGQARCISRSWPDELMKTFKKDK